MSPRTPRSDVLCHDFGDSAYHYLVRYWLTDLVQDDWTDSQVRLHVAATLARHGMEIPFPHRVLVRPKPREARHARESRARAARRWRKLDLFMPLTDAERQALAGDLADCPFVAHDVIARQGEPADSLFILARGRVAVFDDSAGGTGVRDRLATLAAPAYFGEMGLLTGQARGATVVAEDEVLCYRLRRPPSTRFSMRARSSSKRCRRWSRRARPPTMRSCSRCPPTPAPSRRSGAARTSSPDQALLRDQVTRDVAGVGAR